MAEPAARTPAQASPLDALIIGAGFSGLYQLHTLRDKLGLSATVLETGAGVGGTWYWNRYPGARCDSESHSYCYTFSESLWKEWEWSEKYPGPPEILRYLNHVADKFDLKRDIRFGTTVASAHYDEGANLWRVTTAAGGQLAARFLITAVGCLSTANVPKIPGLETFQGQWYHTGHWPHEGVDFRGKRVGQVGTGSTGIQCAPVIAGTAKHLTVFQRTANYSVPARNGPLSREFNQWVREHMGEISATMKAAVNGHPFLLSESRVFDLSPEERQRRLEDAWEVGGLRFRAAFLDLVTDNKANAVASEFLKRKIREIVKDPATAAILANIDHPYAAKRPPIDTDYFETFNRDNVALVDIKADPIERITPTGLQLRSGRAIELDILVFATGFDGMTGSLLKMDIRGRGGRALKDEWKAGPRNYLGLQVAGFPNLFMVTGPGSPSVLCNMPVAIEQHVEWITDCIDHLRKHGLATIEPTQAAMDDWVTQVNAAANATVLPQAKSSWYLGANIPGKPQVFMPYAGGMAKYRQIAADVAARG
ncbi:MAG TPA: NAD(P)/FAD-dependent oxidoreductase, partial [Burkholderiales bacterium]|nr:NAD(P)/FAD-dependent oxidoreductase [Burkholderiales bacterium]